VVCDGLLARDMNQTSVWLNKATPDRLRLEQAQWRRTPANEWWRAMSDTWIQ